MDEQKVKYEQLSEGFKFFPTAFKIDEKTVSQYLLATGDQNSIYDHNLVPPMAVTARAMAAMEEKFDLLPGTVHVTQQVEFTGFVKINEMLTGYFTVNRKAARGKFHMLNIGIKVTNESNKPVLSGEAGFILPLITSGI